MDMPINEMIKRELAYYIQDLQYYTRDVSGVKGCTFLKDLACSSHCQHFELTKVEDKEDWYQVRLLCSPHIVTFRFDKIVKVSV